MAATECQEDWVDRFCDQVHGISSPFVCHGSVSLPEAVQFKVKDIDEPIKITPAENSHRQKDAEWAKKLLSKCPPAKFGHGNKTVYNQEVRKALQLKAEEFELLNFTLEQDTGILQTIQKKLVPNDPDELKATLYGLNVYESSGHFKQHKDTPRSDEMVGTLLIFFPSLYNNGSLVLEHKGISKQFQFGSNKDEKKLHWVAFFGDVDHEVQRMWSGVRVTLAYTLNRGDFSPEEKPVLTFEDQTKELIQLFQQAMQDKSFLPKGGELGFPCYHLYTNGQVFKDADAEDAMDLKRIQKLKGKDFHVALAANHCGLDVFLQPYVAENCGEDKWKTNKIWTKSNIRRRMTPDNLPDDDDDNVNMIENVPGCRAREGTGKPCSRELKDTMYSATGYFGNEGGGATFYVFSAVVVDFPKSTKRSAQIKKAGKAFKPKKGIKRKLSVTETSRKKSKKEKAQKNINTHRTVHIIGARGSKTKVGDGTGDISLIPGYGLKELKMLIRRQFGKASHQKLAKLKIVNEDGSMSSKQLKSGDITDGMTLQCTYNHASGPGNFGFGFGRRRSRFLGFW